ncbi:MAG: DUF1549 domain-containing protein [Planctomycetaceae bacterium]|nr:DUF1549 domain-containing protein [Planctomycetaceae bacterium]
MTAENEEIFFLASLWCDATLSDIQKDRLQSLLRSDAQLRRVFIELVQLHGQLNWDAGMLAGSSIPLRERMAERAAVEAANSAARASGSGNTVRKSSGRPALLTTLRWSALAAIALLAITVVVFRRPPVGESQVAEQRPPVQPENNEPKDDTATESIRPIQLNGLAKNDSATRPGDVPLPPDQRSVAQESPAEDNTELDDDAVIAGIDKMISTSWDENRVAPAAVADDHEWVRRTYLSLTGRIPTLEEATGYTESPERDKRSKLIRSLVSDPRTAENLSVVWTNLLIGRSNPRQVDEESLYRFLYDRFTSNHSWMDTVGELIAAEGRSDENGATNFLLAHLNDQATPATAVTARLFLGRQVHCTQCHDHPFAKDRHQEEFWSLNAFFKQASREIVRTAKEAQGKAIWSLQDSGSPGMTFFENRRGQQQAVMPEFAGHAVMTAVRSRRAELVQILAADNEHQVARAMVNRTWAMFFGYGFTNPIDDIGPHNPASHPELFNFLTQSFVESNYDLNRLMYWISMTQAFGLSSVQDEKFAAIDDPQEGGVPLFSRAYPRPMGPEQVYDSIRIAIRSVSNKPIDSSVGTVHRREWVEQFVRSYGTDENDESLAFDSNIAQALLLMNGNDLQTSITAASNEVTRSLTDESGAVMESLRRLAMATLNREPTEKEERVFRNRYRSLIRNLPPADAMKTATEDMLWAYLNSSEFSSLH